ncbi:Adenosine deaminase [Labeo rohita]|uniref:Adenosine deaminase n=1 Tax=Labeo rohita TaxID=84645 RepID=A0ABQ8MN06_LABRO|nr:Adenosine deaminase [Labeo rohita]
MSLTSYPDNTLCVFYDTSLNPVCRAPSSEDGPRANFATFVEWTLPTQCPAHHLPTVRSIRLSPPMRMSHRPPLATDKPSPQGATELRIVMESELRVPSDQVREPATTLATREKAVPSEIAEWSSAYCNMAKGELSMDLGKGKAGRDFIDWYADLPPVLPPSLEPSVTPVSTSSPEGCGSHVLPREGSGFHVQLRGGSYSQVKPREGSCFHIQLRGGSYSQVKPREGSCFQVKPKERLCS